MLYVVKCFLYSYNSWCMYVCNYVVVFVYVAIYFIPLWQGRTVLADCQSIIINQSINQSIKTEALHIVSNVQLVKRLLLHNEWQIQYYLALLQQ